MTLNGRSQQTRRRRSEQTHSREILVEFVLGERRGRGGVGEAQLLERTADCFRDLVERVLAVLPEVESFATVADLLPGEGGVKDHAVQVGNCGRSFELFRLRLDGSEEGHSRSSMCTFGWTLIPRPTMPACRRSMLASISFGICMD